MGAAGQRLGLRLFLEGMEVPVISASVQMGINGPATASVQVVPGDKILELKARTMVHVFFWDYTLDNALAPQAADIDLIAENNGITVEEAQKLVAERPEDIGAISELVGYKLLFTGEVIGLSMSKTPAGRSAVLQCADFSTYWDTTYQFFASASNLFSTSSRIWAGGASMFDDLGGGHVAVMNRYLHRRPKTPGLENVSGLMGGIIALLEAMGGVPNHNHGVNDFFTVGECKNHILQQLVCEQNDDTSTRLFSKHAFAQWLSKGMASMGSMVTFRDMMKMLFKYIYYEVVPNPCAMYVPRKGSRSELVKRTSGSSAVLPESVRVELLGMQAACWVNERMQLDTEKDIDESAQAKSAIGTLDKFIGFSDVPKKHKTYFEQAKLVLQQIKKTPDAALRKADKASSAKTVNQSLSAREASGQFVQNRGLWRKVKDLLGKALGETPRSHSRRVRVRKGGELDRLHTQIFRPDCFFAAPPRCNVLFPDQYIQFNFSKNFLQEVTRLRLHEEWEFGINRGLLEQNVHFAPAMKEIKNAAKDQGNKSIRGLLPWEIYSGILPKFETIHEINYVAGRSERQKGITKGVSGAAKDYAQRVANFNYIKYRFAARSCEVQAKFNPFMVCGFPAVVIDRPLIIDTVADKDDLVRALAVVNKDREQKIAIDDVSDHIRDVARALGAPSQYLGMVASLAHNIDQGGGNTAVSLTHARIHRITDDDFLGMMSAQMTKESETAIEHSILHVEDALAKHDWKSFKFIRDATNQPWFTAENIEAAKAKKEQEASEPEGGIDNPQVEERVSTMPTLGNVDGVSQFAPLTSSKPPERDITLVSDRPGKESPPTRISLFGEVSEVRSKVGNKIILEPSPYGKLKVGDVGPKGGKIVQIQCFSDAVVLVKGPEINKKLSGTEKYYTDVEIIDGVLVPVLDTLNKVPIVEAITPDTKTRKVKRVKEGDELYLWKSICIYEEVKTGAKIAKVVPIEEGIRPPWFTPLYSNWFIGDDIYEPFFGTGSIVDQSLFTATDESGTGAATFGTGRKQQQEILDKLKDAGNDRKAVLKVLDEAKAANISDVPDVESAVDALAYIYGEVRRLGLDVHRFVNDYTRRPIATMQEILGSADLTYKQVGNALQVVTGEPGFHSTAIIPPPFNIDLLGLLDNPDAQLPRLNAKGKGDPVSREVDPRKGRRAAVDAYLKSINAGSQSLGIGVQG